MPPLLDVQYLRVIDDPDEPPAGTLSADLVVVGGGLGGVAAALAACRRGRRVILTEETDWLGGQLTAQGVSAPDEHRYIEQFGGTRSYDELRRRIRDHYRGAFGRSEQGKAETAFNPGGGWVSRVCCEPVAALAALAAMLAPYVESGRLSILHRHKAVAAEVEDDLVRAVTLRDLEGDARWRVAAPFFLDATELGDLLPLTGTEYVSGAESQAQTGEPHARPEAPAPDCVQSFTYPFAVEYRPGENHLGARPPGYEENRDRQPYTFAHVYYDGRGTLTYRMFERGEGDVAPFWTYRRLIAADNFADPRLPHDVALINWPGNDFRHGNLIDRAPEAAIEILGQAKLLSLGFYHWLQAEAPRDDGGLGYPELLLRTDVMGTVDGLAKYPYIRESRRIQARRFIREQEIAAVYQPGARAAFMVDSVGIGWYMIDIHPGEYEEKIAPEATRPFQIPLGALIPVRMENLLPAAKNLATTHITNGAYRLHPVEWNVGEAAGSLAAFCLERGVRPRAVALTPDLLRAFQAGLVADGIPLDWHVDVPLAHPAFAATQLLSTWALWPADPDRLEFRPDEPMDHAAAAAFLRERDAPAAPKAVSLLPQQPNRAGVAIAWLKALEGMA
jgi:hypothetical protein